MTIEEVIRLALSEDLGEGDHTSLSTIPADVSRKANLIVKQAGILAGVDVAQQVFQQMDSEILFNKLIEDGTAIKPGDVVFFVEGRALSILSAERVALNFLQRMSGIATYTRSLVTKLEGLPVKLLDTRKTTPLLRELEKYSVRMGGGFNHRMGLYDMILIKDNHIDFAGGIPQAIRAVHAYLDRNKMHQFIEIEVRDFRELDIVLETGGINRIMLDNFTPSDLKKAVDLIAGRYETEASGGINDSNIREIAETGVDFISVGALTHQIKSLDLSLKAIIG